MSTRQEIRTKLRAEIKIDPNGKVWSDSVLNTYIDSAYFKLQKDGNFAWRTNDGTFQFNTVPGTEEYPLPTDFIRTDLVRYNKQEIYPRSRTELKREIQTTVPGSPSRYYFYRTNIGFDVIPNASGTIDFDYRRKLVPLTTDSSESEFPEDFDDALVKYGAFLAWGPIKGESNKSARRLEEYGLILDTLLNAYVYDIGNPTFYTQRFTNHTARADVLDR